MTNDALAVDITQQLLDLQVSILAMPGGAVQLLGKSGAVLFSHEISTIREKHIEQIRGLNAPMPASTATATHSVIGISPATSGQIVSPSAAQAS